MYNKQLNYREVFEKFSKRHARATNFFCKVYGTTPAYLVRKYLEGPGKTVGRYRYMPWYYYKRTIKFIEKHEYWKTPTQMTGKQAMKWLNEVIIYHILGKKLLTH